MEGCPSRYEWRKERTASGFVIAKGAPIHCELLGVGKGDR